MKLAEILTPSSIELPRYYYRGSTVATRSAFLTKLWRRPDNNLPSDINDLLQQERVTHVYGLSTNTDFKISRTYNGMSNWGFGVYFAASLEWAQRYGTCISVVQINPEYILAIKADEFAQEVPDTLGGELRKRLHKITGGAGFAGMREEAAIMSKVVKSMKKTAKALYVETEPGNGQICVFGKTAIYPRFYFEIKSKQEDEL